MSTCFVTHTLTSISINNKQGGKVIEKHSEVLRMDMAMDFYMYFLGS